MITVNLVIVYLYALNSHEGEGMYHLFVLLLFNIYLCILYSFVGPRPSFGETLVSFGGFGLLLDFETLVEAGAPRQS
jgi:hypothetical protein